MEITVVERAGNHRFPAPNKHSPRQWRGVVPLVFSRRACDICRMNTSPLGFQCVKVIALSVLDLARANEFYGNKLGLEPALEGDQQVGWMLGDIVLMLKPDWLSPTAELNPRVTILVDDAPATEAALRVRGVTVSDPGGGLRGEVLGRRFPRQRGEQALVLFAAAELSARLRSGAAARFGACQSARLAHPAASFFP